MTERVHEDELHAYADGQLDETRRLTVEAWLAANPADAVCVRDWVQQNRILHAAFDPVLNEPLPVALARLAQREPSRTSWRVGLAAAFAIVASGLLGYAAGLRSEGETVPVRFVQDAAIAHAVFSPEIRHPVEVDASQSAHLVGWLSKRLGAPLHAPDFGMLGFELLGGRLLPGETGPVALFMYQDAAQQRVTLYVRRDVPGSRETAFRHIHENGLEVFYWIDQGFGYALSGAVEPARMRALADAAYGQLVRGGAG